MPPAKKHEYNSDDAQLLASLLPRVMRGMFGADNDPAAALPLAQLKVCAILSDGPRSMSDLSRELGVTLSAMTQIADRLQRARMVVRESEAGDRRVRRLSLTAKAVTMMQKRRDKRVERSTALLAHLNSGERETVLAGLHALLRACGRMHAVDRAGNESQTHGQAGNATNGRIPFHPIDEPAFQGRL